MTTMLYCNRPEHESANATQTRITYRADSLLSTTCTLLSAQQCSLAVGVLITCWTLARAERLSRERRHALECAHGPRAVVRLLAGLALPRGNVRIQSAIAALRKGVAVAFKNFTLDPR